MKVKNILLAIFSCNISNNIRSFNDGVLPKKCRKCSKPNSNNGN